VTSYDEMTPKDARELLQNGGAFRAETPTMTLLMWHAGRGCYALELTPQGGQPAATAACGLENIVATMTGYAPASSWTVLEELPTG
jgi:hypothetical protein